MFDSVNLDQVPPDAEAVAGYTAGKWPTWARLEAGWPNAHRLSIAIAAAFDADCLDIEQGDATPDQAPAWVKRQRARGVDRPVVYASRSVMPGVLARLAAAGISRPSVRVWSAHYTYTAHLCGVGCNAPFVADATQWTNRSMGRNLDESLVNDAFFAAASPVPKPVVISTSTLQGVPVQLVDVPIPLDYNGDGDAPAPSGFLAVSGCAVHDKYDQSVHDPDTIVVPVGVRPSGTPSGWMLTVHGGPSSSTVHATVLCGP